jgi:ribosomal protein L11 methyltransferase
VPADRAEQARAVMLELFPEGFEEHDLADGIELAAYTGAGGEERLWQAFGGAAASEVDEGWEDRWRDFHRPVVAGGIWIGPPWEKPPAGLPSVSIDPGRAFGTGSHATTRLCLELLAAAPRGSLLDVGCGSGVLSIAAARLGFAPITAVDDDPVAITVARDNAAANGVELVVAELDALSGRLRCAHAVTSGYLAMSEPALAGFARIRRLELDGWAADLYERE